MARQVRASRAAGTDENGDGELRLVDLEPLLPSRQAGQVRVGERVHTDLVAVTDHAA
jgi:hypothetical protein